MKSASRDLIPSIPALALPALIATADERAQRRFLEFFAVTIRNPNTRRAYARGIGEFLTWCEGHGVPSIAAVQPLHVAGYIEELAGARSAPTAKLRLAAIRHLFDWLVMGQVVPVNPAASVRGPAHSVRRGKTPDRVPYGLSDMASVATYASKTAAVDVKVFGRASGSIHYVRAGARTEKTYTNFSDDGRETYDGQEMMLADPRGRSTYTADVRLTGPKPGVMAMQITSGPLGGPRPAAIIFAPDEPGKPATRGYVQFAGQRLAASALLP